MTTKKLPKIVLGDREIRILIFLWKWKLVSNAALSSKRFFPHAGPERAYNRLRQLKHAGLIDVRVDAKIQNFAWTLTKQGFAAIQEFLPSLKEVGFKSEYFEHDILVTMFHLGDWLIDLPSHIRLFTEQELRRFALQEYPHWVPKTETHRPDGYFGFIKGDKHVSVALEVECNRKKSVVYEAVGDFYANLPNLHRVIWLVPNVDFAKQMQKKIHDAAPARSNIHNYILISDFRTHGWQSVILLGPEAGLQVSQFLGSHAGRKPVESRSQSTSHLLLNTRRCYKKSKSYPKSSTAPQSLQTMPMSS